jgi:polygalacturonase
MKKTILILLLNLIFFRVFPQVPDSLKIEWEKINVSKNSQFNLSSHLWTAVQIKHVKDEDILHLINTDLLQIPTFTTDSKSDIIQNLISPPETETDTSITILWNKPIDYKTITGYDVYLNGSCVGYSKITNYTINGLKPNTNYSISIVAKDAKGKKSDNSKPITVKTKAQGKVFNILDYGAKPDSSIVNTQAIQKAIDACFFGGIVVIPSGTFISGALFLKSNMTLFIAKGGVLKGSLNIKDYLPFIKTRFEGWEFPAYASLITAGRLDQTGPYNVKNISIRGEGTISGGGALLSKTMAENNANGIRGRGRLICLMNCENVNIQGLAIEEPPCWTIHYTYSKNVTCNGLRINTLTSKTPNGDGIDPDSSINSYIFNCTFSTYDDCIAIKSGKNPQGNKVGKPCENIYISNCNFIQGHSLAIGSEISGGIKNVQVIDCELGNLWFGLQVKTTQKRGGYVEDLLVKDCNLQLIKVVTSLPYNNDGESAPTLTRLRNFEFTNLIMTNAKTDKPVIYLEGFSDTANYLENIRFKNIKMPANSKVLIKHAQDVIFENIVTQDGQKPEYDVSESLSVKH